MANSSPASSGVHSGLVGSLVMARRGANSPRHFVIGRRSRIFLIVGQRYQRYMLNRSVGRLRERLQRIWTGNGLLSGKRECWVYPETFA